MALKQHLFGDGAKHILAIDGGGIRGTLSLGFLERAEQLLAKHYGTGKNFRLSDHFSLVGGTSTGSIFATGLALGFTVSQLIDIYSKMTPNAFNSPRWLGGLIAPKFPADPLIELISTQVGDLRLGTDQLRCGLGIVTKRLDTDSVWIFHNHPNGPFYDNNDGDLSFSANKDLPLLNLIRASTAAPTYFEPEFITIAPGVKGTFVDGGVSPHNNPSLALFMLATIRGYGFCWPTGVDKLHVTSLGTGTFNRAKDDDITRNAAVLKLGVNSLLSLMSDCESMVQLMMQWMGQAHNPVEIDSEIGDLTLDQLGKDPLFQYARYNVRLEREWLKQNLNRDIDETSLEQIQSMDQPGAIDDLLDIGRQAAEAQMTLDQLLT